MSPIAVNIMLFSVNTFHLIAILVILIQFTRSEKIVKCFQFIFDLNMSKKFIFFHKKHLLFNLLINSFLILVTASRLLVQMRSFSLLGFIAILIAIQSHLILFPLSNFFDNIKKFIIFAHKEAKKSLALKNNVERDINLLMRIDQLLLKLEEAFGVQLTVVATSFASILVFYVSLLIVKNC